MRIGINALYLIPGKTGGMSVYLQNYLKHLQQIDTANEYFIYVNSESAGTLDLFNDNFHEIRCPLPARLRTLHYFWELVILPFQAWKDKIDLLHSPANIAPVCLPCASIITIHDIRPYFFPYEFPKIFTKLYKKLLPLMVRRASMVVSVSEYSKKAISNTLGVGMDKIAVVPLASATGPVPENAKEQIKTEYNIEDYILTLLTAIPHKNMEGLVHAYKILSDRHPDVPQLVIAGIKGPALQQTKNKIIKLGLENRIVFLGYVPDSHLPSLYASARLFVFPSRYEGFGLPVLESMSYGVPVVSSNAASLPEVVGDAGLMFDPEDHVQMADAMERVLGDAALSSSLVEKGLKRASEYSWDKVAEQTLNIYKKL